VYYTKNLKRKDALGNKKYMKHFGMEIFKECFTNKDNIKLDFKGICSYELELSRLKTR
jgi:hypothetical protein